MIDGEKGDHTINTLVKSQDEVGLLPGTKQKVSTTETFSHSQSTPLKIKGVFSCPLGG